MQRWLLAALLFFSTQTVQAQFLKARDGFIVDESGQRVLWRGMGLGGWMLQEGYMFHLHFLGQQYRIREKIEEVAGPEFTQQFYTQWLQNHCSRRDIDSLATWGFNSIRLPMHYRLYTLSVEEEPVPGQQTWLEAGFALTDSLLAWCKANQMHLILDLHATPGGQGNDLAISDRDPQKPSIWESEANRQKTIALWKKLAARYADEPWIGGYDIINEPNWGFEDPKKDFRGTAESKNIPLRQLMKDITTAIREVDTRHIIIIEGNGFGNNYSGVLPPWDDNLVLSFHKYGNFNNRESIQRFLELRAKYGIPLWLGESGENSNTWFTEAIQLVEGEGIGWAWWQWKKMGINNPLEIPQPTDYHKLVDYWSGKAAKPSRAEAQAILTKWLENLKIENNIPHKDVVDAMIRQVQTNQTIPFKEHQIRPGTELQAVDFDLGRQRAAYYDRDSARYQYTPGVNAVGNKGGAYRNDGVDIRRGDAGPYIYSIEDGEWCQYTVQVLEAGIYQVNAYISAEKEGGRITTDMSNATIVPVPATGGEANWKWLPLHTVNLPVGKLTFRIKMPGGGFNLSKIQFDKVNH